MGSIISSIATANPEYRFSQQEILKFMIEAHQLEGSSASRLSRLYEASGIRHRYSVIQDFGVPRGTFSFFGNEPNLSPFPDTRKRSSVYEQEAIKIASAAANEALRLSQTEAPQITHLITVSCTGMYAPGLDIELIAALNMDEATERTCINFMGCYGAFNALKMADYVCRAKPDAKVLIIDVELCTIHFQRESTLENWVANSLFADGAAAVLVQSEKSALPDTGFHLRTFFNTLAPEGKDEMAWRIGNTGFEMHLSSQIARNIGQKINSVTTKLMEKAGIPRSAIHSTAIHPGGRRILEVCEEALELPEAALDNSYEILRQFGNMSSATILFVLKRLMGQATSGQKTMSFAFGPGLTFESMILESI